MYIINNEKLKEENNKNKDKFSKLNNLIGGLNMRIKQLLEENKNIRNYKNNYKLYLQQLFILFIESIFNKKKIEYQYQFFLNMFQMDIKSDSKYIICQCNSSNDNNRKSMNLEGYEKIFSGESKKIITEEDEKKQIRYDNKIIIHKDINDTLKEYLIKRKDIFFENIFNDDNNKSFDQHMTKNYIKRKVIINRNNYK